MEKAPYPKALNHIGITVPDINKAIDFYSNVMGWYIIMSPSVVVEDDTPACVMCKNVFGTGWKKFKMAHMSTGNGVGVEIFEFPTNQEIGKYEPFKTGVFHISVQDPNIEALAKKIVEHGGKQKMPITEFSKDKPFKMVYMEDPFGLTIEIMTHSYELTNGGNIKQ